VDVTLLAILFLSTKSELINYMAADKNYAFIIIFYPLAITLVVVVDKCKNFSKRVRPTLSRLEIYAWLYRILLALSIFLSIKNSAESIVFLFYLVQVPLTAINLKLLYCELRGGK
jgi:hypothetical protein